MTVPVKGGAPKIMITENQLKQIEAMSGLGLTDEEICLVLNMSHDTLARRKKEYEVVLRSHKRGKAMFKASVRRNLKKLADEGNVTAAIWLDKTQCGAVETTKLDIDQKTQLSVGIEKEYQAAIEYFEKSDDIA